MTQPETTAEIPIGKRLTKKKQVIKAIEAISERMKILPTGEMARLRRMAFSGERTALYWRLKHKFDWPNCQDDAWETILTAMAFMTPKGAVGSRGRGPHQQGRCFGRALFDGANAQDEKAPSGHQEQGAFSEDRLARLLTSRGEARRTLLLRAIRLIERGGRAVDFKDIAFFLLWEEDEAHAHAIARAYYGREHTVKSAKPKETT